MHSVSHKSYIELTLNYYFIFIGHQYNKIQIIKPISKFTTKKQPIPKRIGCFII